MTVLVDKYQDEITKTVFQIFSWEKCGRTEYQHIHSPEFSEADKAKEYLKKHSHELPQGAKVFKIQDLI